MTDELLAVISATHPLATRQAVRPRDLADEPFILTRAGWERLALATLGACGVTPNVALEVSEASSILALVGEGLGVSVTPGLVATSPLPTVTLRRLNPRADRASRLLPRDVEFLTLDRGLQQIAARQRLRLYGPPLTVRVCFHAWEQLWVAPRRRGGWAPGAAPSVHAETSHGRDGMARRRPVRARPGRRSRWLPRRGLRVLSTAPPRAPAPQR